MENYKITLAYDGSPFSGFQTQKNPDILTIQDEIQQVLSRIFGSPIKIYAAGRTDAGVHALQQVINFPAEKKMDLRVLHRAMDGLLHRAISVASVEIVPPDFHARYSAKSRSYIYVLDNSPHPDAFLRNRAFWYPHRLDVDKMKETVAYFLGEHDFSRFAKNIKDVDNPRRTVAEAGIITWEGLEPGNQEDVQKENKKSAIINPLKRIFLPSRNFIFFRFKGQSFLHSMVRLMVGNLIETGKEKMKPEEIKAMLEPGSTVDSKATNIPGRGLYLVEVEY